MLQRVFPKIILDTLLHLSSQLACKIYVVGGTVRDILLGECPQDLDVVIDYDLRIFRKKLSESFDCSRSVILGKGKQITLKIYYQNYEIDIAQLSENACGIEEDLIYRDFTINAMAFPLDKLTANSCEENILDPLHGRDDLLERRLRMCPNAFKNDPIRMVRGFRLSATKNLHFEDATSAEITRCSHLLVYAAGERIRYEFDRIMDCGAAEKTIQAMFTSGLLHFLVPKMLEDGFNFSEDHYQREKNSCKLDRLKWIESYISTPDALQNISIRLKNAKNRKERIRQIKYAGFLQDSYHYVHSPKTQLAPKQLCIQAQQEESKFIEEYAARMKWRNKDLADVLLLTQKSHEIFELCAQYINNQLETFMVLQFYRPLPREKVDDVFLLALANCTANSHEDSECPRYDDLVQFYPVLLALIDDIIQPHLRTQLLLSGKDLKNICLLQPGPHFKEILCEIERLQLKGKIQNKDEAIEWVTHAYKNRFDYVPGNE